MRVTTVRLHEFRNHADSVLEFEPGVNVLLGTNGQGKTNVVEAIGYLSTLSSHRVATDAPLIRQGHEVAAVQASVTRGERSVSLEIQIAAGRANKAKRAGNPLSRTRDLVGTLRTVLFAPEDLALVRGEPSTRRQFIDSVLVQRFPRMAGVKMDFERVLKQRNALLKSALKARRAGLRDSESNFTSTLSVWNEQLLDFASQLVVGRIRLLDELAGPLDERHAQISNATVELTASYDSSLGPDRDLPRDVGDMRELMSAALAVIQPEELERGITLLGPHRDDIELAFGQVPVKNYASHGEGWSVALALKLATWDVLRSVDDIEAEPVLMLDDVFAELDVDRRTRLAQTVAKAEQVIITAAVEEDVPQTLAGKVIRISHGTVESHGG